MAWAGGRRGRADAGRVKEPTGAEGLAAGAAAWAGGRAGRPATGLLNEAVVTGGLAAGAVGCGAGGGAVVGCEAGALLARG